MGVFTTPAQLMLRQKARFVDVSLTMHQAHEILAKGGKTDFELQLTGKLTTKMLRQIGHPYARGARVLAIHRLNGFVGVNENTITKKGKKGTKASKQQVSTKGKVSDLPINKQTGKLRRAVQLDKKTGTRGAIYDLYSAVSYAKHVLSVTGTRYMRPRGLLGPKGELRIRYRSRHAATIAPVKRALRKP